MKMYRIVVIGGGFVGLSNATLLAQYHHVTLLDINPERIDLIRQWKSPIHDNELQEVLDQKNIELYPTTSWLDVNKTFDLFVISTPTDYDPETNYFDTSSVDSLIEKINQEFSKPVIVIKSTLPIGHTAKMNQKYPEATIVFSPEFLREGQAFKDNLYPSRIIVGSSKLGNDYLADIWKNASLKPETPVLMTSPTEAEAIKLFANSYLAMRVAYFNELDTFAEQQGLSSTHLIEGIGLDPRIGMHYNNPSFGYGGYCFPKDTKQLLANFHDTPQKLIQAIVESNQTRKEWIASVIISKKVKTVGIYRLVMKQGSNNYRQSAILDIMNQLQYSGIQVIVYEPLMSEVDSQFKLIQDLGVFKLQSELIVTNRFDNEIQDVREKVYTRDVYSKD
jgi:UDPglucose 6-dehydrogenase